MIHYPKFAFGGFMKKILVPAFLITAFIMSSCCQNKKQNVVFRVKDTPDLLAQVNGEPLTEKDLGMRLRMRLFDFKKNLVESHLRENYLDKYLAKKGYSRQDFFEKEIKGKAEEVSDSEARKFYKENFGSRSKQTYDQLQDNMKNSIKQRLKQQKMRDVQQKFFDDLLSDVEIVYNFSKPVVEVKIFDKEIEKGNKNAPVTIVEYTEFKCPYCKRAQATLDKIHKEYGNKIRHIFRNFPIPSHKFAREAANAAYCAHEQGKFWEYHDKLFENQTQISEENIIKWAEEFKLDMSKFKKCYEAKTYDNLIERDLKEAEKLDVSSTPTFFINGTVVLGAQPFEEFKKVIDSELKN